MLLKGFRMKSFERKLWIGLAIMALFSPLGVILPEKMDSRGAWGEWNVEALQQMLGYVPEGLRRLTNIWSAPIAGYNFGNEQADLLVKVISYVISGMIGLVAVAIVMYFISRLMIKNGK
ncbi:MAG: hypothetical protein CSYNP_03710 [Syntrophus sp. SKADARSKE-3]|nr:hypothetical protein [Syntrophus sp. SKADARSKE-3]